MSLVEADPERYGSLSHPGDTLLVRHVLAGRCGRRVVPKERCSPTSRSSACVAIGESQSAFRLTTYVNVVDPVTPVFDGFFVHARGGSAPPLDESGPVRDPVGPARALPRRPPRTGALLRGRDRPDGPRLPPGPPARQRQVPALGGGGHRRTPTSTRSWSGASTAARCPIAELAGRVAADRTAPLGSRRSSTRSTPDRSTTCSRPRSRTSIGGCATARRRRGRRAWRCATTIRRSSSSTTSATRRGGIRTPHVDVPVAVLSGMGNDGAPISRHLRDAPSRSAPSSSRRSTRARPTTAPGSTPPPTPPSPRAGSSQPTPPRSRPSPPSSTPPDNELCVNNRRCTSGL